MIQICKEIVLNLYNTYKIQIFTRFVHKFVHICLNLYCFYRNLNLRYLYQNFDNVYKI